MPRIGLAVLPLDVGHCPRWLFERMKKLSRSIVIAICEEFGVEEILKRLSDPIWFQSLSAVIGMDWNSSGTTTITLGAIKSGIFDIQNELGLYVCGGKKVSRKTPAEIEKYGIQNDFKFYPKLIYASKIAAKVDSCLIQNLQSPFKLYHHNFIFTKTGQWCVIQQGMSPEVQKARRYHWLSSGVKEFTEEPHSGIISDIRGNPLNLTARESRENKEISVELVREEPKTFLRDFKNILNKNVLKKPFYYTSENFLMRQKRLGNFTEMELYDKEFYWHPVLKEKFDLKRLEKTIFFAHSENPESFEKLLSLKRIGPKTIRALSLVAEIIYGSAPSYEDPARYSFAHGGKDGTPFKCSKFLLDTTISAIERGIQKSKISLREKLEAEKRLNYLYTKAKGEQIHNS